MTAAQCGIDPALSAIADHMLLSEEWLRLCGAAERPGATAIARRHRDLIEREVLAAEVRIEWVVPTTAAGIIDKLRYLARLAELRILGGA